MKIPNQGIIIRRKTYGKAAALHEVEYPGAEDFSFDGQCCVVLNRDCSVIGTHYNGDFPISSISTPDKTIEFDPITGFVSRVILVRDSKNGGAVAEET